MRWFLLFWAFVIISVATGCGFSYQRYPCQAADQWHTARCTPPGCVPHGDCAEYLIEVTDG